MDQLKKVLTGRDDSETSGIVEQMNQATTLSWSNRLLGFGLCLGLGITLTFLGLFFLFTGSIKIFVQLYTVGNILSISSTLFLMGPWKQLQRMFNGERWIATLIYFVFLGLTLYAACGKHPKVLAAIICCVFQFLAMLWYSASYIPFAQKALKNTFSACI